MNAQSRYQDRKEGSVFHERYRLLTKLSSSSIYERFVANSLNTNDKVILSIAPSNEWGQAWCSSEFQAQARAEPKAHHPNIVRIIACNVDENNIPYLVEEFVSETNLSSIVERRILSNVEALELLIPIAEAIEYAHARGLIHGDLSLEQVRVSTVSKPWIVKVRGFLLPEQAVTNTSSLSSSVIPVCASPEKLLNFKRVGPASDVWSFGVLTYRILTGKWPFYGPTLTELIYQVSAIQKRSLEPHSLSQDWLKFITQCLAYEPDARPHMHDVRTKLQLRSREPQIKPVSTNTDKKLSYLATESSKAKPRLHYLDPYHFENTKCQVTVTYPKAHLYLLKVQGHLDREGAVALIEAAERLNSSPFLNIFCDWFEMTGYDSDARKLCTDWVLKNRHRAVWDVLVRSKLVAMGVSVAQLVVGIHLMKMHTDRNVFQKIVQASYTQVLRVYAE